MTPWFVDNKLILRGKKGMLDLRKQDQEAAQSTQLQYLNFIIRLSRYIDV